MQNKAEEESVFGSLAKHDGYSEASNEEYVHLYNIIFGEEIKAERKNLLDVGCGTGINSIHLAKLGFCVTGIDISSRAIHEAQSRADRVGINATFKVEDAENLKIPDNSFDICFCGAVLHHFKDLNPVARELYRVTKNGGVIYSYDPNALHIYSFITHNIFNRFFHLHSVYRYFSPNERAVAPGDLRTVFEKAGFTNFAFNSATLHSKKKDFNRIRNIGYMLSSFSPGKLRKGNMLLMSCMKDPE